MRSASAPDAFDGLYDLDAAALAAAFRPWIWAFTHPDRAAKVLRGGDRFVGAEKPPFRAEQEPRIP